jgi:hypothetical protein
MECERSARRGRGARVSRVHDLPFMVRQSVPRDSTFAACTPRRAFVALLLERRCTRALRPLLSLKREPGVSTASWEVTGVLYRGGVPIYERSESASPLERAAGAKILGPKADLLDF